MPTTINSNVLMADRATNILLGRAVVDDRLLTTTTISPLTSGPDQYITSAYSTPTAAAMAQLVATDEQHADISSSPIPRPALYSIEDLGHWTAATNCTALVHALLASFSVILVSELGDKTFIITAIMAMKNSRSLVFISSAFALFLMTVLSVGMGVAVTVIPEVYTHYASIVLFLCFGVKMLKESYDMLDTDADSKSEFEEVKRSLEEEGGSDSNNDNKDSKDNNNTDTNNNDDDEQQPKAAQVPMVGGGGGDCQELPAKKQDTDCCWWSTRRFAETLLVAPIVIKVFTMVFVAEWGDRSQISTVILAAREDVVGVFIGSLSGHVFCTGLAVIGGRFVADMISVKTLTLLGGIIFLFFAVFAIFAGPGQG